MSAMTFATPETEPYLVLAQELMRHVYAEESPEEINAWLLAQMGRLSGSKEEGAILLWDESFELYERIMAQRAKDALIPEGERKTLTWPWASWSNLIDPLGPGMLAVMAAADGQGKTLYAECIDLLLEVWQRAKDLHIGGRTTIEGGLLEEFGLSSAEVERVLRKTAHNLHIAGIADRATAQATARARITAEQLRKAFRPLVGNSWDEADRLLSYLERRAGLLEYEGGSNGV